MQVDPTARCPHRASGWTLARAHAAAAPALQKPLTKRRKRFRGLRARPLSARRCVFFTAPPQPLVTTPCAVQPYRAFPRLLLLHALKARSLRLGCRFACFRHTHRSLPFACERFAGSATQPDYCETRPLGVRVAGQERLSGTALRYGS